MHKQIIFAACVSLVSGCAGIPKDAFLLTPSNLDDKRLESRIFATADGPVLLKDGATILENMGYKTDLVNPDLGLITATRHEDNSGFISIISAGLVSTDKEQAYRATFTAIPSLDRNGAIITRLSLQHIVFNSDGEATSVEPVRDKDIYKLFYERLEASTFIEPSNL